ncbi:MAG: DegT/DnrJ/EryC1/StrS family aminotransferase [Solirubrobacterales bacterium]
MNRIPLLVPDLPPVEALMPRLEHIFASGRATNFGGLVVELEDRLSKELGCYVITAANATLALELCLTALELAPGSEINCPALTFPASATAIVRAGHSPNFVDVDRDTWCSAAKEIILGGGVKNVTLAVSAFGAALSEAQMAGLSMPIVIDAAPAWGNQEALRGALTCYSLHATKALIAGEGGAIACHDQRMAERLRALTNFGIGTGMVGTNAKMSEYHAAVALASLDTWPERSDVRRAAHAAYWDMLTGLGLDGQDWYQGWTRTIFPVLLPLGTDVGLVMARMEAAGIETRRWYYPLVCDSYRFSEYRRWKLPVSRSISSRLLGLPFFTGITHAQMERVVTELKKCLA